MIGRGKWLRRRCGEVHDEEAGHMRVSRVMVGDDTEAHAAEPRKIRTRHAHAHYALEVQDEAPWLTNLIQTLPPHCTMPSRADQYFHASASDH